MLLKSIGLIGILITAKKLGLISEIKKYLEGLRSAGEEELFNK